MAPTKPANRLGWARLGPFSVAALMLLWGVAIIGPAALPH